MTKFKNSGCKSRGNFIRIMIFDGYLLKFDEEQWRKIYRLCTNIASNVNQIAVRVNSTGKIYDEDIAEIKEELNQLWLSLNFIQSTLQKLRR